MTPPLEIILDCEAGLRRRVRYGFETLLMARSIPVRYCDSPSGEAPVLYYGTDVRPLGERAGLCSVLHQPDAWRAISVGRPPAKADVVSGVPVLFGPGDASGESAGCVRYDIVASAFYLLTAVAERLGGNSTDSRALYSKSEFDRLDLPQDLLDRYAETLRDAVDGTVMSLGLESYPDRAWPDGARFAVALTHDVDFVPSNLADTLRQGVRTLGRHLVKERAPLEAVRAMSGLLSALVSGRDAYGCVPEIIERERKKCVRSSFQVAVARPHPLDVNYDASIDRTRTYLSSILAAGFDLCLHGSYTSTSSEDAYVEEVRVLTNLFEAPRGSRQHFLAFDYDTLFRAQERSGIEFDMSVGFPDRTGSRVGFSFPYFPYNLAEDRVYDVVEIGLHLMDATLRGYMKLRARDAWVEIARQIDILACRGGGASVVWHPIVFGDARDPGYADLYWRMVDHVREAGGLATDGRRINDYWRDRASAYPTLSRRGPEPDNRFDSARAMGQLHT